MERRILGPEDRDLIKHDHEKMVADFLIDVFPNTNLYYERREYAVTGVREGSDEQVVLSSTIPDFELEDVNLDKLLMVVEVTRFTNEDAKDKQKQVMAKVLPDVPYIVLLGEDLDVIQNRYNHKDGTIFERTENLRRLGKLANPTHSAAD